MKEKILEWVKFTIFLWMMAMGFFTTYAFAWVGLGIPTGWWASLIVIVLTIASVYGFIKWMED